MRQVVAVSCFPAVLALALLSTQATAQPASGKPPAVGVVRVERQEITQSDEFVGRVQAIDRVALVARVTGFLEKRLFVEGTEVKKGDLLYMIEQPPFQAQVNAAKASIDQFEAQHRNAQVTLQRAQTLLSTPAGQQSKRQFRARQRTRPGGADCRRAGPARDRRHQPRLYRYLRTNRRQDHRHSGHRRQCRLADERHPGEHRQPGSDVRALSGLGAGGARSPQSLRIEGRVKRCCRQTAPSRRTNLRARRQARLRLADDLRKYRHM